MVPAVVPYMRVSTQEVQKTMRGYRGLVIASLLVVAGTCAGCQGVGRPRTVVSPEPSLSGAVEGDTTVANGPQNITPVKTATVVDRHPLFSKPRDYWETSGDNKVVKAAAATFVGVPVGIYGEFKQIIVGAPPEPRY
jgi:hypothetical protein